jgi:thiol-disulfide isomerase/thioredoxin
MATINKYILLAFSLIAFVACDKIEQPFENIQTGGNPIDTTNNPNKPDTTIQKVLIEEFTGHTCGNCPMAAKKAEELKAVFKDQLIVVAIHSGHFSNTQTSTGKYITNFKTPAGDAYNSKWTVDAFGNPQGFVNRSKINNNNIIVHHSAWATVVETLRKREPALKMAVNLTYDANNRALNTSIKTKALKDIGGKYMLVLYFVEDKIVDWQKDYSKSPQDIPDYVHRHVLRDNISSTWGDEIISNSMAKGDSIVKTYNNFLLKQEWNPDNCSVVAYVYDAATYEILQVEEVYLKK